MGLEFSHESQVHGADAFCEVLMLTLCRVAKICQQRGRPFPTHLVVQSDNTTAQARWGGCAGWSICPLQANNSVVMQFMACLVCLGFFTSATINFLMVGHTHEDIDQLFALMVQWILRKHNWQTPEELMEFLQENMQGHFVHRGEEFSVRPLMGVRYFEGWMEPLQQKLEGAFQTRYGIESPHSFVCKLRRDLTQSEASRRDDLPAHGVPGVPGRPKTLASPHGPPSPNDVMMCVKTFMRSKDVQQAPVMVIAHRQKDALRPDGPNTFYPLKEPSETALSHMLELAALCEDDFNMPRAAEALRSLATGPRVYQLPRDNWLPRPNDRRQPLPGQGGNPYFPHLPETSWHLLVKPAPRVGMQGKRRLIEPVGPT